MRTRRFFRTLAIISGYSLISIGLAGLARVGVNSWVLGAIDVSALYLLCVWGASE